MLTFHSCKICTNICNKSFEAQFSSHFQVILVVKYWMRHCRGGAELPCVCATGQTENGGRETCRPSSKGSGPSCLSEALQVGISTPGASLKAVRAPLPLVGPAARQALILLAQSWRPAGWCLLQQFFADMEAFKTSQVWRWKIHVGSLKNNTTQNQHKAHTKLLPLFFFIASKGDRSYPTRRRCLRRCVQLGGQLWALKARPRHYSTSPGTRGPRWKAASPRQRSCWGRRWIPPQSQSGNELWVLWAEPERVTCVGGENERSLPCRQEAPSYGRVSAQPSGCCSQPGHQHGGKMFPRLAVLPRFALPVRASFWSGWGRSAPC